MTNRQVISSAVLIRSDLLTRADCEHDQIRCDEACGPVVIDRVWTEDA